MLAEEKRPPVHVRPTDMPEQLQEQAELQLKVLSATPDTDLVEAQRRVVWLRYISSY